MKILITGGCGFLGSNVAESFLRDGADVTVLDSLTRTGSIINLDWLSQLSAPSKFRHYKVDITDEKAVANVFRESGPFDYVCHFAAQVAMTTSIKDPRLDFRINALGTFNLLEAVRIHSPTAFFAYSSTNKVYGDLPHIFFHETETRYISRTHPAGFDEQMPLDLSSPYGCSKGAADQYVRDWSRVYGLKTVVFRHSSIYGGRQFATFDQGWVGWFCSQAILQLEALRSGSKLVPCTISGNGKQVRDILHATDLIRLYKMAYGARDSICGEIFNIGGGRTNSASLIELFQQISELLGSPILQYTMLPPRHSDQKVFIADTAKICKGMGWAPSVSIKDGLKGMLEWLVQSNAAPR